MLSFLFVLGHTLFNTLAQIFFKLSSESGEIGGFALWQVFGNFSAFVGVLSYTMSMRWLPLHIAYPLTQGLAVLGVTLIGAQAVFHEQVVPIQWIGIGLVGLGIALISITHAEAPSQAGG